MLRKHGGSQRLTGAQGDLQTGVGAQRPARKAAPPVSSTRGASGPESLRKALCTRLDTTTDPRRHPRRRTASTPEQDRKETRHRHRRRTGPGHRPCAITPREDQEHLSGSGRHRAAADILDAAQSLRRSAKSGRRAVSVSGYSGEDGDRHRRPCAFTKLARTCEPRHDGALHPRTQRRKSEALEIGPSSSSQPSDRSHLPSSPAEQQARRPGRNSERVLLRSE